MNIKNFVGLFVAALVLLLAVPAVSAFARINYVETESVVLYPGSVFGVEAGQTLDLRVVFKAFADEEDVRVTARVLGEPGLYENSERFDVLANRTYSKWLQLTLPNDLDELDEDFILEVQVESQSAIGDRLTATFAVQRANDALEFLSVDSDAKTSPGQNYAIDVVVKNRGRNDAEDTFVIARIPELDISKKIFLEDLGALDQSDEDEEDDSIEGTILLKIPSDAAPGLYTIELKAVSEDAETTATRRVEVVSGSSGSAVVSSATSKTFAVNADGKYTLTVVNSGNQIMVYNLVVDADDGLNVEFDDSVVVVPAGSSKTVTATARANREGEYDFTVNVHDANNALIGSQSFTSNVEGRAVSGNAAVVLTIILAIVFVVLLVVLIVLLTRKPAKAEEIGESYY